MRLRSRASPSGVMPPEDSPFSSRIAASASAVPDDAYASRQCSRPNSRAIASISRAGVRLRGRERVGAQLAVGKNRCDMLTQPSFSDSRRSGVIPRPMMNSVEPPPMSIDQPRLGRRRQHVRDAEVDEARLLVAGDDVDRKPERRFRLRQECPRHCFATRKVLVATARTADGCSPDSRSRKRARHASAARARGEREAALLVDARAEADRLAPRVEAEDLVAFDAADLEPEAVRAQVDDGERRRVGDD